MKIALFKNTEHMFDSVSTDALEGADNYARLSEYVDVEFVMLPYGEAERRQAEAIDDRIAKKRAEIELLEQKKAELLAIGCDSDSHE